MAIGVIVGLVVGILAAGLLAVRIGTARPPRDVGWWQLSGAGVLAGIGFTVAIFVAGLAFPAGPRADAAKVGILIASLLAGLVGSALLLGTGRRSREVDTGR